MLGLVSPLRPRPRRRCWPPRSPTTPPSRSGPCCCCSAAGWRSRCAPGPSSRPLPRGADRPRRPAAAPPGRPRGAGRRRSFTRIVGQFGEGAVLRTVALGRSCCCGPRRTSSRRCRSRWRLIFDVPSPRGFLRKRAVGCCSSSPPPPSSAVEVIGGALPAAPRIRAWAQIRDVARGLRPRPARRAAPGGLRPAARARDRPPSSRSPSATCRAAAATRWAPDRRPRLAPSAWRRCAPAGRRLLRRARQPRLRGRHRGRGAAPVALRRALARS